MFAVISNIYLDVIISTILRIFMIFDTNNLGYFDYS